MENPLGNQGLQLSKLDMAYNKLSQQGPVGRNALRKEAGVRAELATEYLKQRRVA